MKLFKNVKRFMYLHEFQGASLLRSLNIPTLFGFPARSPMEAFTVASQMSELGYKEFVVKAQVHTGGRGQGFFKESSLKGSALGLYS